MKDDTISRQQFADAFWKTEVEFRPSQIDEVMRILGQLPSAQFDKDINVPDKNVGKIGDLIDRQAAIEAIGIGTEIFRRVLDDPDVVGRERAKYAWGLGLIESDINDIRKLPSAQPEYDCVLKQFGECTYDKTGCSDCEIKTKIRTALSAQPEIIHCRECKWWGYDDDDGAVRVCHAAKHGFMSSHWDIQIYRTYRGDFWCADAERREDG